MKIDIRKIAISCGGWLFKFRSYTPIPIILVLLFCFRGEVENHILTWSCGPLLLMCGEGLRFWSLRYIGKFSRTRKKKGRMLVRDGPYLFMRNPLYAGNLLIWTSFAVMGELAWLMPLVIILFFVQYQCIVLWEEECLREFFPSDAEDYFRKVPRWVPRWRGIRNIPRPIRFPDYSWINVLERERGTLQGLVLGCIAMILKEVLT